MTSLEDQIKQHKELSKKIVELEEQRKALGMAIMQQMQSNVIKLGEFQVRCCTRLSIQLSIDDARLLDAVKLEEAVDREKIKVLYNQGHSIKGVTEIKYIQVSSLG